MTPRLLGAAPAQDPMAGGTPSPRCPPSCWFSWLFLREVFTQALSPLAQPSPAPAVGLASPWTGKPRLREAHHKQAFRPTSQALMRKFKLYFCGRNLGIANLGEELNCHQVTDLEISAT